MKQLTKKEQSEIIYAFKSLVSVIELAKQYEVSRQAIYKLLKKNNIESNAVLIVNCSTCGAKIKRHRCRVRRQKNLFCDNKCQSAYSDAKIGKQKMARYKVSEYFKLKPEHIVHFDDGNDWNTTIYNLAVFENQRDHILHHLGRNIKPLWRY